MQARFVNISGRVAAQQAARDFVYKGDWQKRRTEAVPLIHETAEHRIQPKYIYGHKWTLGNVVTWDHAAPLLRAICDYRLPQRGLLHRVTIESRNDVPREAQMIGSLRTFGDPVLASICGSQVLVALVALITSICRHPDPESPSAS